MLCLLLAMLIFTRPSSESTTVTQSVSLTFSPFSSPLDNKFRHFTRCSWMIHDDNAICCTEGKYTVNVRIAHPNNLPTGNLFSPWLDIWERWPLASTRGLAPGPRTAGEESLTWRWLHSAQLGPTINNYRSQTDPPLQIFLQPHRHMLFL